MSSPSMRIDPLDGSTIRLIMRSRVVLPEPDDPTSTVVLREGMTSEKSSTATASSVKRLDTARNSIDIRFSSCVRVHTSVRHEDLNTIQHEWHSAFREISATTPDIAGGCGGRAYF